jgi:hypothetical protein
MHHFILPSPKSDSHPSLNAGSKCQVTGNSIKEWMPQLYITKELLGFGSNLDMLKEHYNEHYETVVDELNKFYKKRLLELPEVSNAKK